MESFFKPRTGVPSSKKQKKDESKHDEFIPWVEKYRPKSVDEVAFQDEVVTALKNALETQNLPHLLFYGPPGTGKTSTILAIAKQLFGHDLYKSRVLELNASDERGINVVRTKIKSFSQIATGTSSPHVPPFKLIILDEADSMTADAQTALRRTMEAYSKTTRFCLICNYVSRIIDPLTSRCAKFRFKPVSEDSMKNRLQYVCEKESIQYSSELGNALVEASEGDLRKAIMFLQSAFSLHGTNVTAASIIEISGRIPAATINQLMKASTSNSFDQLQKAVSESMANGYPANQIISQIFDKIVDESSSLSNVQRAHIAEQLAISEKSLQDGADESLQLLDSLSTIMKENQRSK